VPAQKISVEESLRAYTSDASFAAFSEKSLGSLQAGKLADLVVLDRNLLETPGEDLAKAGVVLTMVDGRVMFERASSNP